MVVDKLQEFESWIRDAMSRFQAAFGSSNPIPLWRSGRIQRTGHLDAEKQIEYSCHGAGCTVDYAGRIVSFDFDGDGQFCYTPFKFALFVDDDSLDEQELVLKFTELVAQGVLVSIVSRGVRLSASSQAERL